ncbi:MAG: MogA/MoaB family molybdenum cofactor biosynthesis protein [Chlorobia bacterium]|nr:MogA/MoaB family molybdenum cofactor biosynthesis protein [Fimbriimonadaceae bacterium]
MKIGLITISDTRSFEDDDTGHRVMEALREYGFDTFETVIVADEMSQIRHAIRQMSSSCSAIFTTGGTGFSPRDITPEATSAVLDRRADNLCELMRSRGADQAPESYACRGVAGTVGDALVVNLPGSPLAAKHSIHAIGPLLNQILCQLRGDGERVGVGC